MRSVDEPWSVLSGARQKMRHAMRARRSPRVSQITVCRMDETSDRSTVIATVLAREAAIPLTAFTGAAYQATASDATASIATAFIATTAATREPSSIPPAPASESFADYVATRANGPVLSYSLRLSLLREASRRGIHRFEANLVIASVQHRLIQSRAMQTAAPHRRWWPRLPILATVVTVQSVICFGLWRMLHG